MIENFTLIFVASVFASLFLAKMLKRDLFSRKFRVPDEVSYVSLEKFEIVDSRVRDFKLSARQKTSANLKLVAEDINALHFKYYDQYSKLSASRRSKFAFRFYIIDSDSLVEEMRFYPISLLPNTSFKIQRVIHLSGLSIDKVHEIEAKDFLKQDINSAINRLLYFIFTEERDFNLISLSKDNFRGLLEQREIERKSAQSVIERIKYISIENNTLNIDC